VESPWSRDGRKKGKEKREKGKAVFENTYFTFFSDFKKNMTFYVFLK